MRCAFCDIDAKETYKRDNVILIAHFWCLEDRLTELKTDDLRECLLYEDEIRQHSG